MKKLYRVMFRLLFAMIVGVFIGAFSGNVTTVHAQETQEVINIEEEDTALASQANDGSTAVFLLLGGMLLIILTVVITVVATFVVTAPIADEI